MSRRAALGLAAAAGLLLAAPGRAQSTDKPKDVPSFGVTTELVYVRFHVERKGDYLGSLSKDQIRVLEDGRPQSVALLETPAMRERSIPPEVTLALDVSSSVMDIGLLDERLLKEVFFAGLSEQTKVGLCAFGGELRCLTPPTREVGELVDGFERALVFARETRHQGTRLYDSIAEICRGEEKDGRVQRAVVIFSDGLDNQGGKVSDAVKAAADADARIYAVKLSQAFQDTAADLRSGGFGPPRRALYDYKKFDLDKLAAETGGRTYEPGKIDKKDLAAILSSIAKEIAMENVVGYQPEGPATGKKRKVKVELVDKSLGSIKDGERSVLR